MNKIELTLFEELHLKHHLKRVLEWEYWNIITQFQRDSFNNIIKKLWIK